MFSSVFGLPIRCEAWNKKVSLPFYIAESYEFCTTYIADKRCIVLTPTEELATLPALKKQIEKIQKVDNAPVVFELKNISFYRRKSLIENKIPFFTERQVFLPFIGTILIDEKETEKPVEKFVFSTQQLLLFYLYGKKKQMYVSEAGRILPFTAMILTRAVKQLAATDLFLVTKDGVNKVIESKYNRVELFEKLQRYLSSPVRKTGFIEKSQITSNMVLAGETALAEKTILSPGRVFTYAINKRDFDKRLLTDELVDPDKQVRLELWEYDPGMFLNDNVADNLSAVLSLRENTDERIEKAVEELIEGELDE